MSRERLISIVIPNRDGEATLGRCLQAAFASRHPRFEVVVVDDASRDRSVEIAQAFPCKLVRLERQAGVSRARNAGAQAAAGDLLFFIDSDCLLEPEALAAADARYGDREDLVLGGSYTPEPWDRDFFSAFQSISIHHSETRRAEPDYVAAHAMVIDARLFDGSGGFRRDAFMGLAPGVEDVELCHRLRRAGCKLEVSPEILVQHVFRFSLARSLANAFRKARRWTRYSLANRDLLADSGTASRELKANVLLSLASAGLVALAGALGAAWPLAIVPPLLALDLLASRGLLAAWRRARGPAFCVQAAAYYLTLYAGAVGLGAAAGTAQYLWASPSLPRSQPCTARSGMRDPSS
jgi:glycosyltransferase involved in cell wall biosynthesis